VVRIGARPHANACLFSTFKFTDFSLRAILAAAAWPGAEFVLAYGILFAPKKVEFRRAGRKAKCQKSNKDKFAKRGNNHGSSRA